MPGPISSIWYRIAPEVLSKTGRSIDEGCDRLSQKQPRFIFFRADDAAVPGKQFVRLLEIFSRQRVPLCLAVVPAWLTKTRWKQLSILSEANPSGWCWHQHGWRHINHEREGKKQEFGPGRTQAEMGRDLARGRDRLQELIGKTFYPVFTPPWNRCDNRTLEWLKALEYVAVSRSRGGGSPTAKGLPDFYVSVDLHTRKEADPISGWDNLFEELRAALSTGLCGIMIHHRRMNEAAFGFLEMLLKILVEKKDLRLVNFRDLAESKIF